MKIVISNINLLHMYSFSHTCSVIYLCPYFTTLYFTLHCARILNYESRNYRSFEEVEILHGRNAIAIS